MTERKLPMSFDTPGEIMIEVVHKIAATMKTKGKVFTSRYRSQAQLKKWQGILMVAMSGGYGFIPPPDKERIAHALDQLGELIKQSRSEIRRPKPSRERGFHF